MIAYENTLTQPAKTRRLIINFNTCEVRCPLHEKDVDVLTACMGSPSQEVCSFFDKVDKVSGILCKWRERNV